MPVIAAVCLVLVVAAAASPDIPWWWPWIGPIALGIVAVVLWHGEATSTGGGDPQPGLVAAVGTVSVAVLIAGILIGYLIRHRRRSRGRS